MKIITKLIQLWRDWQTYRKTVKEWLGEGGRPVAQKEAERRALQCRGCQWNQRGEYPESVGHTIKRHVEAKVKMRLEVVMERELHTCKLCRCHLPLKVHVPLQHIQSYQREDVRQAIINGKPDCWQLGGG